MKSSPGGTTENAAQHFRKSAAPPASGACSSFTRQPTVETVGYFLSPLRGCADTSALEREMDRQVYALYPPAAKFRQTGGPTPEEINIVEEAG